MIDAYENYYKYKLSADPFRLSPDHRFAFSHPSYAKARAYLEFAIRRGEGFITITGGPGTGKTTLINEIVAGIGDANVLMATLNSTQLESRDLLHMVAAAFGLRYGEASKATLLLGLEEFLTQQQRRNKRAVLIVDEAQGLSPAAMEELRLLANLQHQSRLLLQVVLVGQEQLRDIINAPGMEHLSQRIIVASHLDPLSLPDTVTYVEHRLKKVRWQGDPAITEDALRLVHKFSGGVPRRINLICSRLFLFGGLEGTHELTGEDAQTVIADLQQESLLPDKAPPGIAPGDAQQSEETAGLSLSLPRDAGEADTASGADAPRDAKQERAGSREDVEDILSSRASLRQALGEVVSTLEEADLIRPAPKRRPRQPDGPPAGVGTSAPKSEKRQRGTTAAPEGASLAASRSARKPRPESAKPDKRRNTLSLLVVVAGLALAYALIRLDKGDAQPEAGAPGGAAAESIMEAEPRSALAAARDDVTTAVNGGEDTAARAIAGNEGEMPEPVEQTTETADAGGEAPESVSPQQDAARPPETVSVAAVSEESGLVQAEDKASGGLDVAPSGATTPAAPVVPDNSAVTPVSEPVTKDRPAAGDERSEADESRGTDKAAVSAEPQAQAKALQSDIDEQKVRLAQEARERFARQLEKARLEKARLEKVKTDSVRSSDVAESAAVPSAPAPTGPRPSQPKTATVAPPVIQPSVPKVALAAPNRFGAPAETPKAPVNNRDRIKAALLEGQWTSQGKPATLLPSDVTLCKDEQATIACWSVPRNVNTKFGEALYKVEATLQDFSAAGTFRIAYRTLVRLVGSGGGDKSTADSADDNWQVSRYTTTCELTFPNRVSCRDEKGVQREYSR